MATIPSKGSAYTSVSVVAVARIFFVAVAEGVDVGGTGAMGMLVVIACFTGLMIEVQAASKRK